MNRPHKRNQVDYDHITMRHFPSACHFLARINPATCNFPRWNRLRGIFTDLTVN